MLTCGMRHSCGTVQNPEAPSRVCLRLGFAILVRMTGLGASFSVASFTANVYNTCFFFWGVAPLIVSRSASCTALHRDGASAYGCQPQMALRASLGNAAGVRSSRLLFCCAFLASRASNSSEAFGVSQEEGYAIATLRRGLCALCGHLW